MGADRLEFARLTVDRAGRWLERIQPKVADATERLSDKERQEVTDFFAAAAGEIAAIVYQCRSALEIAYTDAGESGDLRDKARRFSKGLVHSDFVLAGLMAVRALNVHVAPQESGRMLIAFLGSLRTPRKGYWTHPGISDELHERLDSGTKMQDSKRSKFNAYVAHTDVMDVLRRGLESAVTHLESVEDEIRRLGV